MNIEIQNNNDVVMKKVDQLEIDLNNKKRITEVIKGMNFKCNELRKKLENEIKTNRKLTYPPVVLHCECQPDAIIQWKT